MLGLDDDEAGFLSFVNLGFFFLNYFFIQVPFQSCLGMYLEDYFFVEGNAHFLDSTWQGLDLI